MTYDGFFGARYERRSLLITANQPFGDWGKDPAMTVAAIDRLEPFRASPSWFLRITCDRCGQERMFSETHAAGQRDMLIRVSGRRSALRRHVVAGIRGPILHTGSRLTRSVVNQFVHIHRAIAAVRQYFRFPWAAGAVHRVHDRYAPFFGLGHRGGNRFVEMHCITVWTQRDYQLRRRVVVRDDDFGDRYVRCVFSEPPQHKNVRPALRQRIVRLQLLHLCHVTLLIVHSLQAPFQAWFITLAFTSGCCMNAILIRSVAKNRGARMASAFLNRV
jgi:hypothetical protein